MSTNINILDAMDNKNYKIIYIVNTSLYNIGVAHTLDTFIFNTEDEAQEFFDGQKKNMLQATSKYKQISIKELMKGLADEERIEAPQECFYMVDDIFSNYFQLTFLDGKNTNTIDGRPDEVGKSYKMKLFKQVVEL